MNPLPTVLIFYYCITNHHKLSSLKKHTFIIPQFLWVRNLVTEQLRPLLKVLQSCNQDVTSLHSYLGMRENPLPSSLRLLAEFIFLWLYWLLPAVCWRLHSAPGSRSQFIEATHNSLPHGFSNMAPSSSQLESLESLLTKQPLYSNAVTEVASHYLCHVLLASDRPHPCSGRRAYTGCVYQEAKIMGSCPGVYLLHQLM